MSGMYLGQAESIRDLQHRFAILFGPSEPGGRIEHDNFNGGIDLVQGDRTLECNLRAADFRNGLPLYIPEIGASLPEPGTYEIKNEQELPSHTPMPSGFRILTIDREGDTLSLQYAAREIIGGLSDTSSTSSERTQTDLESVLTYNISEDNLNAQFSVTLTKRRYKEDTVDSTTQSCVLFDWTQTTGKKPSPLSIRAYIREDGITWEANYTPTGKLDFMKKYAIHDGSPEEIAHVNFTGRKYRASLQGTPKNEVQEQEARAALKTNFGLVSLDRLDPQTTLAKMLRDSLYLGSTQSHNNVVPLRKAQ